MPSEKLFPVNDLFHAIRECATDILVLQGGARSGKTYSVLQWIITYLLEPKRKDGNITVDIVRKENSSHSTSGRKDFFDILGNPTDENPYTLGIYDPDKHRKSFPEQYDLNGNTVRFLGIDNETKKRGSKRNILYINEANELGWDDWVQLSMRTSGRIVIDYNPSDEDHWIYDKVIPRKESTFIQTTWRDNDFLPQRQIDEIESLRETDPELYEIFGMGNRGKLSGKIYSNWTISDTWRAQQSVYGLDFGYNNPSALVEAGLYDSGLYIRELIYEKGLTNSDLIAKMKALKITGRIYCDAAEPQRIEELRRSGFDARPADKSVKDGIDFVKRHRIHVVNSPNVLRELKVYKNRTDKNGNVLDEVLKLNDHAMDAIRYAAFTEWYVKTPKFRPLAHEPILDSDFSRW